MTWLVLRRIPGAGCWEKVTEGADRVKAQWKANRLRPLTHPETWRTQHVDSGEAWQCTFHPPKRAKWEKVVEATP